MVAINNLIVVEIPKDAFLNQNADYPDWYLYDAISKEMKESTGVFG